MPLRHPTRYTQYRGHSLVAAPSPEPITLQQVKDQLRIDGNDEDTQLNLYIEAARSQCENLTGLALITQTWQMTLDRWPTQSEPWWDGVRQGAMSELYQSGRAADIFLPRYPLQQVDSITADGNSVAVADVFITDTQQRPGRLVLKTGQTFPSITEAANAIVIQYTAGYGDDAADVPADLRLALIQMVAALYENRGDGCSTEDAMAISGAKRVFDQYRVAMI